MAAPLLTDPRRTTPRTPGYGATMLPGAAVENRAAAPKTDARSGTRKRTFSESQVAVMEWTPYGKDPMLPLYTAEQKHIPNMFISVSMDKGVTFTDQDPAFVNYRKNHMQISVALFDDSSLPGKQAATSTSSQSVALVELDGVLHPVEGMTIEVRGIKYKEGDRQGDTEEEVPLYQASATRIKMEQRAPQPVTINLNGAATLERLHFQYATPNNARRTGIPNPRQGFFCLVVKLMIHIKNRKIPALSQVSDPIIVRGGNPGLHMNRKPSKSRKLNSGEAASDEDEDSPQDAPAAGQSGPSYIHGQHYGDSNYHMVPQGAYYQRQMMAQEEHKAAIAAAASSYGFPTGTQPGGYYPPSAASIPMRREMPGATPMSAMITGVPPASGVGQPSYMFTAGMPQPPQAPRGGSPQPESGITLASSGGASNGASAGAGGSGGSGAQVGNGASNGSGLSQGGGGSAAYPGPISSGPPPGPTTTPAQQQAQQAAAQAAAQAAFNRYAHPYGAQMHAGLYASPQVQVQAASPGMSYMDMGGYPYRMPWQGGGMQSMQSMPSHAMDEHSMQQQQGQEVVDPSRYALTGPPPAYAQRAPDTFYEMSASWSKHPGPGGMRGPGPGMQIGEGGRPVGMGGLAGGGPMPGMPGSAVGRPSGTSIGELNKALGGDRSNQ